MTLRFVRQYRHVRSFGKSMRLSIRYAREAMRPREGCEHSSWERDSYGARMGSQRLGKCLDCGVEIFRVDDDE